MHRLVCSCTNYSRFENGGVRLWNGGILSKWVGERLVVVVARTCGGR